MSPGPRGLKPLARAIAFLIARPASRPLIEKAIVVAVEAKRFAKEERHRMPLRRRSFARGLTILRESRSEPDAKDRARDVARSFMRETLGGHVDVARFEHGISDLFPELRSSRLLASRERVLRLAYAYIERERLSAPEGSADDRYWEAYDAHLAACPGCQDDVIGAIRRTERLSKTIARQLSNGLKGVVSKITKKKDDESN